MPAPVSPLSSREYKSLLRDVRGFVKKTKTRGVDKKVTAYWHIGQRIEEEAVSEEVGYYGTIIKDLARDLHVSPRTLYDAVQFHTSYTTPPDNANLNWSHHRLLLRLAHKKHRAFYTKLIESEKLSARALEAAIQEGLHRKERAPTKPKLKRPADPEFLYRAKVLSVIDGDTLDLEVDLGFGVYRRLRVRLADIDAPAIDTAKGRKARDFVTAEMMHARTICVKTIKVDMHGRYVVHLFYLAKQTTLGNCFSKGDYMNDALLQEKLARPMPSG